MDIRLLSTCFRTRLAPGAACRLAAVALSLLLCAILAPPPAAQAQGRGDARVRRLPDAESTFQRALAAFESGNYERALAGFDQVVDRYPLNQKTTAAALMAAKALYRQGEYTRAENRLSRFLQQYPSSSYLGDARRLRGYAREQLGTNASGSTQPMMQLGIALPLSDQEAPLTQAMFNGIRLAVAAQNERGLPVRMIFRDTEGTAEGARQALRALAGEGADVVVGPLYSRTARPAGAVAEEERLAMIAPLATEQGVSQGRRYVFQANPTIDMRGRQMAIFARQSLRKDRFGVVSQPEGTLSYTLAESFREEAERQGAEVVLNQTLTSLRAYSQLNERIPSDLLMDAEVIYMPVSGEQAPRLIQAALTALDRADVPRLRVLGNGEWGGQPIERPASRYRVTYADAFRVDPTRPPVQSFIERYRAATGETPDQLAPQSRRLAYTGFDVARFAIGARTRSTDRASTPSMAEALRDAPRYEGLGMRIDFQGTNVNEALFFYRYRDGRVESLR